MPERVHYWFADWIIYPTLCYLIRYRRKVVEKNMLLSFPEWDERQQRKAIRSFYHQLADTIVEVIYGFGLSNEQMDEHVQFTHVERVKEMMNEHDGVIIMLGHLGNWEWLAHIGVPIWETTGAKLHIVYRKQKNKAIDEFMAESRKVHKSEVVDKNLILRHMIRLRGNHEKAVFGMLSDQKPRPEVTKYWTTFLNQETGFLDGSEVLGRKFDYPVLFGYVTKQSRGHYSMDLRTLCEQPKQAQENEITGLYAQMLEANIRENPSLWLWTHNRWKWQRKEE